MMKNAIIIILIMIVLLSCVSNINSVFESSKLMENLNMNEDVISGLLSLDQAVEIISIAVEERIQTGSEIVIAKIDAPLEIISKFIINELIETFNSNGKLVVLARGENLEAIDAEHNLQMLGLISDESAVGIGHFLGAKVVITGTFDIYGLFSQLRIRAIDVRTSELLASYSTRIRNNDPILVSITPSVENTNAPVVTEETLEHINRGQDYFVMGKYEEAHKVMEQVMADNNFNYRSVLIEVGAFTDRFNNIIRNRNYNAWKNILSDEYFSYISSPEFLRNISEMPMMRTRGIVLRTSEDYFINVVVPSRANVLRVDDIEFNDQQTVTAYYLLTIQSQITRLRAFQLRKINNEWKIIQ